MWPCANETLRCRLQPHWLNGVGGVPAPRMVACRDRLFSKGVACRDRGLCTTPLPIITSHDPPGWNQGPGDLSPWPCAVFPTSDTGNPLPALAGECTARRAECCGLESTHHRELCSNAATHDAAGAQWLTRNTTLASASCTLHHSKGVLKGVDRTEIGCQ